MLCPFPKRVPGTSCQTWMVSGGDRCCEDKDVRESGCHGLGEALRRGDLNGEWCPGGGRVFQSVLECSMSLLISGRAWCVGRMRKPVRLGGGERGVGGDG